ncbi:unnamed protein product [Closterium sp. NIES-54]
MWVQQPPQLLGWHTTARVFTRHHHHPLVLLPHRTRPHHPLPHLLLQPPTPPVPVICTAYTVSAAHLPTPPLLTLVAHRPPLAGRAVLGEAEQAGGRREAPHTAGQLMPR